MSKWSPSERKKRSEKCKNPKGFTMKQFCKNLKTKNKHNEVFLLIIIWVTFQEKHLPFYFESIFV